MRGRRRGRSQAIQHRTDWQRCIRFASCSAVHRPRPATEMGGRTGRFRQLRQGRAGQGRRRRIINSHARQHSRRAAHAQADAPLPADTMMPRRSTSTADALGVRPANVTRTRVQRRVGSRVLVLRCDSLRRRSSTASHVFDCIRVYSLSLYLCYSRAHVPMTRCHVFQQAGRCLDQNHHYPITINNLHCTSHRYQARPVRRPPRPRSPSSRQPASSARYLASSPRVAQQQFAVRGARHLA